MANLMTTVEVAEHLGCAPGSVRRILKQRGITEQRGYDRAAVLGLNYRRREGQGRRTDLHPDNDTVTNPAR